MKVLMIVEGFGDERFGVEKVVESLAVHAVEQKIDVEIITMVIDGAIHHQLKGNVHQVSYWSFIGQTRFHPKQLSDVYALIKMISPTIIHCHGCMSWLQVSALRAAGKIQGVPTLISFHGMLESWLWRQKGAFYYALRKLYWNFLLRPFMSRANYIHAITEQESMTLRREFPCIPQLKISNAIDLAEYTGNQLSPDAKRYFLFVGRLHPKKGVDLLLHAFKQAAMGNVRLIIAGPDFDVSYTLKLKLLVEELGLLKKVFFVGPVYGEKKNEWLQKAWCMVIPSYSDVVALVNLESAASFTPTITTTMTGLNDWEEEGGGLLVKPELEALTMAICAACGWSIEERMQKGRLARELMEQKYSWDVIGKQWVEAYKIIADSGKADD